MIQRFPVVFTLVSAILVSGNLTGAEAPGPALAWHFLGTRTMTSTAAPGAVLVASGQTKEWNAFATQIKNRLNDLLPGYLQIATTEGTNPRQYLRPLLDDLHRLESVGHLAGKVPFEHWVIAIRLDEAGAQRWTSGLFNTGRQLQLGEPEELSLGKASGWTLPRNERLRGFSFAVADGWFLVTDSFAPGTQAAVWVKALNEGGRPTPALQDQWLKLEFRPPALGWEPTLPVGGAVSQVTLAAKWQGPDARTEGTLQLASLRAVNDAAWTIPKGLVNDPLVSFTAVRGVRDTLAGWDAFQELARDAVPDQWYGWSRRNVAFINEVALPVKDAEAVFGHLERAVPAAYNPRILKHSLGEWLSATNASRLMWRGLPVFVPYLGPATDEGREFIRGGIFPVVESQEPTPAPAELFAQFEERNNLIYYDWEITASRLAAYEQMKPFIELVFPPAAQAEGVYGAAWLSAVQSQLGNSITEAARTGDQTADFTRKSPLGLTAIELWLLTRWLDSAEFPKFPYSWPRTGRHSPAGGENNAAGPGPVPAQRVQR